MPSLWFAFLGSSLSNSDLLGKDMGKAQRERFCGGKGNERGKGEDK